MGLIAKSPVVSNQKNNENFFYIDINKYNYGMQTNP